MHLPEFYFEVLYSTRGIYACGSLKVKYLSQKKLSKCHVVGFRVYNCRYRQGN